MKDSIFHVPIANDFIDLEQLFHISPISFSNFGETVGVQLSYMFTKDKVSIHVRARELFSEEEMKAYDGYKLTVPALEVTGNVMGVKFSQDSIRAFDEKVRTPIYNAWKTYRESKSK